MRILILILLLFVLIGCRERISFDFPMDTTTIETTTAPETEPESETEETTTAPPETTTIPETESPVIPVVTHVEAEIVKEETVPVIIQAPPPPVIPETTTAAPIPVPIPQPEPKVTEPIIEQPPQNIIVEETEPENIVVDVEIIEGGNNPEEGGGTIGVMLDKFQNILNLGFGAMYECEKGYVYFETTTDYQTINRKDDIHEMILSAGCYNVAEKLLDENLVIADDWLIRKNPMLIVKCVDTTILGDSVTDTANAHAIVDSIINRQGWIGINAVLGNNIVLISSQLLETEEGKFLAELYMAKSMYPELFTSIDINEIIGEIWGDTMSGIYVYGVA
jgi:hypothetical protein